MKDPSGRRVARRSFLGGLAGVPFLGRVLPTGRSRRRVRVTETSSAVAIGNDQIEVTIRRDNGGIRQIRATGLDLTMCDPVERQETAHWRLAFYTDEYEDLRATSVNAPSPTIDVIEETDRSELRIEWTHVELFTPTEGVIGQFSGPIVSRVIVQSGNPLIQWRFDVQNDGSRAIKTAACPVVNGITPIDPDGDDELVVPMGIGRRSRNPSENGPLGITYPSSFGTMQFTAYVGDSGGFYTDVRDTDGYAKELLWGGGDPTMTYQMKHYAPRRPGADLSIPYPAAIGALDGDWYDAADRYRDWLLDEGWLSIDDAGVPDWVREKGAMFEFTSYTRPNYPDPLPEHPYDEIVDWMATLTEYLHAPLGLQWRGWQTHGRSSSMDWFPPREGMESFRDALGSLQQVDTDTLSFLSARWLLTVSDFWAENRDRIDDWLLRTRDGSRVEPESYGHDHPEQWILYHYEFPQSGIQHEIRNRLRKYAAAGGRGAALDGFPHIWVPTCYADHHDHPPGRGGNWFPAESRRALQRLVDSIRTEQSTFVLSGEGLSDFYLPYLQVGTFRDPAGERHGEVPVQEQIDVVPLLPYTLGEFHDIRGVTIFLEGYEAYQRLVIGRTLVWGAIPMVNMDRHVRTLDEARPVVDYLGRAARARSKYANRFLSRGRMLRQPSIDSDVVAFETGTETPGDETVRAMAPDVLSSAWESNYGELGFVVTNVFPQSETRTAEIHLGNWADSLPDKPWLAYTVTNGVYERTTGIEMESRPSISVELESADIGLLVVAHRTDSRERALDLVIEAQNVATDAQIEMVQRAKRQFENGELTDAIALAEAIIANERTPTATTTDTKGEQQSTNQGDSQDDQSNDGTESRTAMDTPGFSVTTWIAGFAAAVVSMLKGMDAKDE